MWMSLAQQKAWMSVKWICSAMSSPSASSAASRQSTTLSGSLRGRAAGQRRRPAFARLPDTRDPATPVPPSLHPRPRSRGTAGLLHSRVHELGGLVDAHRQAALPLRRRQQPLQRLAHRAHPGKKGRAGGQRRPRCLARAAPPHPPPKAAGAPDSPVGRAVRRHQLLQRHVEGELRSTRGAERGRGSGLPAKQAGGVKRNRANNPQARKQKQAGLTRRILPSGGDRNSAGSRGRQRLIYLTRGAGLLRPFPPAIGPPANQAGPRASPLVR